MSIFSASSYRDFLRERLKTMPKEGRGQVARIAKVLQMHPTRLSQVLHGHVNLTMEQAGRLANHLGLSALETEFFLAMIQLERAGTEELKAIFRGQLRRLQEQSRELKHRVPKDIALSENQKAVFYSNWAYSAVRLATSIEALRSIDAMAERFGMSGEKVRMILDFLFEAGLVVEKEGQFQIGPQTTHLEKTSPLILRHHSNWRLKAISRHERSTDSEIAYTCPVSLRREDQAAIREMIMQLIEKFLKKVVASEPPDTLACLNIDWFQVET
jgi:uncharacterized protein (TIGR02147 family)